MIFINLIQGTERFTKILNMDIPSITITPEDIMELMK